MVGVVSFDLLLFFIVYLFAFVLVLVIVIFFIVLLFFVVIFLVVILVLFVVLIFIIIFFDVESAESFIIAIYDHATCRVIRSKGCTRTLLEEAVFEVDFRSSNGHGIPPPEGM